MLFHSLSAHFHIGFKIKFLRSLIFKKFTSLSILMANLNFFEDETFHKSGSLQVEQRVFCPRSSFISGKCSFFKDFKKTSTNS